MSTMYNSVHYFGCHELTLGEQYFSDGDFGTIILKYFINMALQKHALWPTVSCTEDFQLSTLVSQAGKRQVHLKLTSHQALLTVYMENA